jgi:hypothetical protein
MVSARRVSSPWCSLSLLPWTRREGALQRETPFLAELELCGIPAHAWAGRMAVKLLEGSGLVDHVAAAMASRTDMSCFRLSVWTHDVAAIPAMRWLAVLEPGSGLPLQVSSERPRASVTLPRVLWYRIRFSVSSWLIGYPLPATLISTAKALGGQARATGLGDHHRMALLEVMIAEGPAGHNQRRRRRHAPRRHRARCTAGDPDAAAAPVASLASLPSPTLAAVPASDWWAAPPSACSPPRPRASSALALGGPCDKGVSGTGDHIGPVLLGSCCSRGSTPWLQPCERSPGLSSQWAADMTAVAGPGRGGAPCSPCSSGSVSGCFQSCQQSVSGAA